MRCLLLPMLGLVAFATGGCSLRSLDELKRCTGQPESGECPSLGVAGVGTGAQGGAGLAGSGAGAGATEGGSAGAMGGSMGAAPGAEGGAGGTESEPELILSYAHRPLDEDETLEESKAIRPIFSIENLGEDSVDLSELSIRYYYTLDNPMPQDFVCDFVESVVTDCDGVAVTFGVLNATLAKDYAEITFAPPDGETWLIPRLGGKSGRIQLRFMKMGFSVQNQTNDYSFDEPKLNEPAPWDQVTLYRNGVLVWGIEPT